MTAEYTRAITIYGALVAISKHEDIHEAALRDEITRTIRRIHKKWPTILTSRLKSKLSDIGAPYKDIMTTSEIYRLNKVLRRQFGVDRIIHVEHMNGGVASISNKLMASNPQSPEEVMEIIESMTFMAARLLVDEDHLCESTTIEQFNEWNNI